MTKDPLVVAYDEAVMRLCRTGDALRPMWHDDVYWPQVRKMADAIGMHPMQLHNFVEEMSRRQRQAVEDDATFG